MGEMKGSLKIGAIRGIGIYLHWTFAVLIGFLFIASLNQGQTFGQVVMPILFILALFACVLLHELGHALTAKRYGINTRDITLLPIGGLARLERIPEKPMQEFWVALAGPLVNLVIAALLFAFIALERGIQPIFDRALLASDFLTRLAWVNLFILAFNLLPAFPMDGGRVLRALLAARIGRRRATRIAADIGQLMAVLFGFVGFLYSPLLIFIAIFVYVGARAEADLVETTSLIEGLQVKDAMMTRFRTLAPQDTMQIAISELLAGSQEDFPVVLESGEVGVLRRKDVLRSAADHRTDAPVSDFLSRKCEAVKSTASLERTLETMRQSECKTVPVADDGRLVGLLTLENISELVMLRSASDGLGRKALYV
jgi:Zn-dependent protease/CBS domain-containing protein